MKVNQPLRYLLVAASLAALALPAVAGHRPFGGREGRGPGGPGFGPKAEHRIEHLAMRLELSDGQRAELRQLMEDGFAEMQASGIHDKLMAARQELGRQIDADSFDETAIRAAAAAAAAVEADMAVERAQRAQAVRKILTPEQLDELAAMREQRTEHRRFGRRHHRGGPRGDSPGIE